MNNSKLYRPDIDGLRAIAVMSVVTFHAFPQVVPGGFIGVDIFFVISGFLITRILIKSINNPRLILDFYIRRVNRIVPALLLVLSTSLAIGYLSLMDDEFQQLGKHATAAAGFSSNFLLWSESGYFDTPAETKILLHLWSLGIEEQFYLIWPLLLFLFRSSRPATAIIILIGATVSFFVNLRMTPNNNSMAFYFPHTRFWELLTGGTLAYWASHFQNLQCNITRNVASFSGLSLLALGFYIIDRTIPYPGAWALIPVTGACLVIISGQDSWLNQRLLSNRLLVGIGLASYPLYLWHWPLLAFSRIIGSRPPNWEIRLVLMLLALALAWATYRFIERPVRIRQGTLSAKLLTLALLTLGAMGYAIYSFRLPSSHIFLTNQRHISNELLRQYSLTTTKNIYLLEGMKKDRQASIRAHTCHISPGDAFDSGVYKSKCLALDKARKNILVVGDSHAADLYAALSISFNDIHFLQATGAGCTPIRNLYRDHTVTCYQLLDDALKLAQKESLDAIILSARWNNGWEGLTEEVRQLKEAGREVIIAGPPLEFTEEVIRLLARQDENDSPESLYKRFVDHSSQLRNEQLLRFSRKNSIDYLDRISLYCNENGNCPLLDEEARPLIIDYGHLLVPGSTYLGRRIQESGVLQAILETRTNTAPLR